MVIPDQLFLIFELPIPGTLSWI